MPLSTQRLDRVAPELRPGLEKAVQTLIRLSENAKDEEHKATDSVLRNAWAFAAQELDRAATEILRDRKAERAGFTE